MYQKVFFHAESSQDSLFWKNLKKDKNIGTATGENSNKSLTFTFLYPFLLNKSTLRNTQI